MVRKIMFLSFFFCIAVLSGCKKEAVETVSNRVNDETRVYAHSQILHLEDGKFFVDVKISSDDDKQISQYVSWRPIIKVSKYVADAVTLEQTSLDTSKVAEKKPTSPQDIKIEIINSNIESGYQMSMPFANLPTTGLSMRGIDYKRYDFENGFAKGAYTYMGGGYIGTYNYYSRNYYFGWYTHRGYRQLGGNNNSYTFSTTPYTEKKGTYYNIYTVEEAMQIGVRNNYWIYGKYQPA